VPATQVTFGTDYPYFPGSQIAALRGLGLPPDQLRAIESGNAMGLLPRLKT
jgi:predicted TIM-barrel fold metal-dependent hydrolase